MYFTTLKYVLNIKKVSEENGNVKEIYSKNNVVILGYCERKSGCDARCTHGSALLYAVYFFCAVSKDEVFNQT
eukprot:Pgem_evm1s6270